MSEAHERTGGNGDGRGSSASRTCMLRGADIRTALEAGRVCLALQPLVSAQTGLPVFYECLLRLAEPDGRLLPARDFMDTAEAEELAGDLDARALALAVECLKAHPSLVLSVNVSGLTVETCHWLEGLHVATAGDRALTERLVVEITETRSIENIETARSFVAKLQALGCRVAIDDFGAGYTSFRNLKMLRADIVKIDGAFVENVAVDAEDQAFIHAVVDLARSFKLKTAAEWVGSAEAARFLKQAGVDYLQGHFFGQPAPMGPLATGAAD